MQKSIVFIISLSFFTLWGQSGEQVYQFMNLPTSTRQAALGGDINAVWDKDPNMALSNPSLMNEEMHMRFGANYANYLSDVSYGTLSFVYQMPDELTYFSLNGRYIDYGDFVASNENGFTTGNFQAQDAAISLGFARNLGDFFTVGSQVHYVTSTIEQYQSQAILGDVGITFHDIDYNNTIALTLRNFGYQITPYNDTKEKPPFQVNLGFTGKPENVPIMFTATLHDIQSWDISNPVNERGEETGLGRELIDHLTVGAELFPDKGFNLRFGYNFRRGNDLKIDGFRSFSGLSLGVGLRISYFKLDYAMARYHSSGHSHMFGLSIDLYEMVGPRYRW